MQTGKQTEPRTSENENLNIERSELLEQLEDRLELPMLVLGFVWLALLVAELIWGLSQWLEVLGTIIWIVFIIDFGIKLILAPRRLEYIKDSWITVLALLLPALRVFRVVRLLRILRAARAARGLRLFRVVSSLNRGMKSLGAAMARRGFSYVLALTIIVTFVGAAGMYAFENSLPSGAGLESYGAALWWTAMIMTSLGSEYWPQTPEGRTLCFLLAVYGFAVFGYVTATLATFFIGRDAENDQAELAGEASIRELRDEIRALREEIRASNKRSAEIRPSDA